MAQRGAARRHAPQRPDGGTGHRPRGMPARREGRGSRPRRDGPAWPARSRTPVSAWATGTSAGASCRCRTAAWRSARAPPASARASRRSSRRSPAMSSVSMPSRVRVAQPDTATTPDSGTTTASRQTLVTGEACRRACVAAVAALRRERPGRADRSAAHADRDGFPYSRPGGQDVPGEYDAATEPVETDAANPVLHVAYSYACQLAILGPDDRLERIVAAHDSGLVVNPQAFEGQVEGGVAMGIGYALTEDFPLADCVPTARFGQLGLLHAAEVPPVRDHHRPQGRHGRGRRWRGFGRRVRRQGDRGDQHDPDRGRHRGGLLRPRRRGCGPGCRSSGRRTAPRDVAVRTSLTNGRTMVECM